MRRRKPIPARVLVTPDAARTPVDRAVLDALEHIAAILGGAEEAS